MSFLKGVIEYIGTLTSPPDRRGDLVWYVGYGSNMDTHVFQVRRKITPIKTVNVTIPSHVLTFSLDGMPYLEPCFATVRHRDQDRELFKDCPDAHGVAYLIYESEYRRILATEGGHGYNDVGAYVSRPLECVTYDGKKLDGYVLTDGNARSLNLSHKNRPSKRYLNLVLNGAKTSELQPEYIKWLETHSAYIRPETRMAAVGQLFFICCMVVPMLLGRCFLYYDEIFEACVRMC
eukprot:CFRG2347T1